MNRVCGLLKLTGIVVFPKYDWQHLSGKSVRFAVGVFIITLIKLQYLLTIRKLRAIFDTRAPNSAPMP
jgi:hypothetical protein